MTIPDGLFVHDGGYFEPSEFTRGPWRPDAQHGGPPAALLAHLCEPLVDEGEFLAQLTVELVRPVPLTPLRPVVERVRVSRRVVRIEAQLHAGDSMVARCSALALRTTELDEPEWAEEDVPATGVPPIDAVVDPPRWASGDVTSYHRNAVEHRFTTGTFREPGPAVDWVRLRLPVVAGTEVSGLERVAAAADFGSGISAVYGANARFGLINANLIVSLHRHHVGEWVSLDAMTHVGAQGTGVAITRLGDVNGQVGLGTQSLLGFSVGSSGSAPS